MIGTACQALSEQACLSRGLERALVLLTRLLHTLPNLVTVLVANTSDSFLLSLLLLFLHLPPPLLCLSGAVKYVLVPPGCCSPRSAPQSARAAGQRPGAFTLGGGQLNGRAVRSPC